MASRAMVVVGSGSSSRFGADKLMERVAGKPIMSHTVSAISSLVDEVVLVCRPDQQEELISDGMGVATVAGGVTRTESEIAGLKGLSSEFDLVGIHDAARPLIDPALVERLFTEAERSGGAIPVVSPRAPMVHRETLEPVEAVAAQTPQVFRHTVLAAAYRQAEHEGFEGRDTADVVSRFTELTIVAVPGDPRNVKITYPRDLDMVREALEAPQRRS